MKAVLTRAAVGDLAGIARHIGRDSVPAARRFTAALERRALAVGRNPRMFPFAEGLEDLRIRRRLYRDYLIFFVRMKVASKSFALFMARATGKAGTDMIGARGTVTMAIRADAPEAFVD